LIGDFSKFVGNSSAHVAELYQWLNVVGSVREDFVLLSFIEVAKMLKG
jgi:hypothetical protein